jgi:hypothetical protein
MSAMANKRIRRSKIGLGNDVVDEWKGRCGSEIVVIEQFLERVGEEEIKVDWLEVLAGIPGVSNRDVNVSSLKVKMTFSLYWSYFRGLTLIINRGERRQNLFPVKYGVDRIQGPILVEDNAIAKESGKKRRR